MPETPVHEYRELGMWKDEIGFPEQGVSSSPAENPVSAQYRDQIPFCRSVSRRPDLRHDPRTFLLGERVHANR